MCIPLVAGVLLAGAVVAGAAVYSANRTSQTQTQLANQQAQQQQQAADAAAQQATADRAAATQANNDLIAQITLQNDKQVASLGQQNTLLVDQINAQSAQFATAQQGLLDAQNKATAAAADRASAAEAALKNTGQRERKPNYSKALAENARANAGGVASTMLTGAAGVPATSLTLGRTSLLGA